MGALDSTFFGKKKDKFGVAVILDVKKKEILKRKYIKTERKEHYEYLRKELEKEGFIFKAVVIDGFSPLFTTFSDIPIQMCIFHQKAIIRRYLTTKPKLEAAKELKNLVSFLGEIEEKEFKKWFNDYLIYWKDFLEEKTFNSETGNWFYTHKRLRSAVRSIQKHLPYLFTYQKYPELNIPNTTNHLDGGRFSHLKKLLKNHPGMSKKLKEKVVDEIFENLDKKWKWGKIAVQKLL